jgi:uncharacterized protein YkwD
MALRRLLLLVLVACLSGCNSDVIIPEVISNPASAPVAVSPAQAALIISQLRSEHDLPPVVVSSQLNAVAQAYADLMAAEGKVDHDLDGVLTSRLSRAGYVFVAAGENIGGGYHSVGEAFDRWEASPVHLANILAPPITEIGIATAFNAASPYRTFWVLVLAKPG